MKNSSLINRAILDSLGVLAYISLISLFMNNAERIFGSTDKKIISPIVFLMLFVFSALVTSGLVLGKPMLLYLDGSKKEGVRLFIYTGLSLFVLLLIVFAALFWIR